MRFSKIILFFFCLSAFMPAQSFAITETTPVTTLNGDNTDGSANIAVQLPPNKSKKTTKKGVKQDASKVDFDFNHPTKKWLWLAILLAIISVALRMVRNTGALSSVLWAIAGICLIVWLLKIANVL